MVWRSEPPTPLASPGDWRHEQAVQQVLAGRASGIGFAVRDINIGGIDLDHCYDPSSSTIAPWAQRYVDQFPDAYIEVTVSGTGLRILGSSELQNFAPKYALRQHGND